MVDFTYGLYNRIKQYIIIILGRLHRFWLLVRILLWRMINIKSAIPNSVQSSDRCNPHPIAMVAIAGSVLVVIFCFLIGTRYLVSYYGYYNIPYLSLSVPIEIILYNGSQIILDGNNTVIWALLLLLMCYTAYTVEVGRKHYSMIFVSVAAFFVAYLFWYSNVDHIRDRRLATFLVNEPGKKYNHVSIRLKKDEQKESPDASKIMTEKNFDVQDALGIGCYYLVLENNDLLFLIKDPKLKKIEFSFSDLKDENQEMDLLSVLRRAIDAFFYINLRLNFEEKSKLNDIKNNLETLQLHRDSIAYMRLLPRKFELPDQCKYSLHGES